MSFLWQLALIYIANLRRLDDMLLYKPMATEIYYVYPFPGELNVNANRPMQTPLELNSILYEL